MKPDLVQFVNGIPLVVMEAKSPTLLEVWKTQAVKQLRRYQEAGPARPSCSTRTCCASPTAAPTPPEGQARLIAGLLNPPVLLDILRDYVVFEHDRGRLVKKLPRYQQYRAVRHAAARILEGRTPEERGGVVWHTQGSGKSLTMLWLAIKLRRSPALGNPTIVVVTDRTQLDRQITATFKNTSVVEPERATSTRRLRELLCTNNGHTIMTTIQKLEDVLNTPAGPAGRQKPPHPAPEQRPVALNPQVSQRLLSPPDG